MRPLAGQWIAQELRAGHRVVLNGRIVEGPLDLGDTDVVRRVFKCRECTFTGPLSAPDVIFERTVDLSGSTFSSEVDFTGATFRAPALFRSALSEDDSADRMQRPRERPSRFLKAAVFSLVVFDDLTSFGGSEFHASAAFRDTRFSDATFTRTGFAGTAFAGASFRGVALFNDARFTATASFADADFRRRADFARAIFNGGANFGDTRFGDGASFLSSQFYAAGSDEAATFQNAVSGSDLNFTFTKFNGEIATFSHLVSAASLDFRDAEFDETYGVTMDQLQVRELILAVDAVNGIDDPMQRREVLANIEESAKERGDLGPANDAHYDLKALRSEEYHAFWGALDYVFYRGIAGYFVRPLRPLVVLAALATLVALLRMRRGAAAPPDPTPRSRSARLWRGTRRRCGSFLTCLLDTFAGALPRSRGQSAQPLTLHARVEVLAYRLLLVCALVGLANSNPTLREMVDTLL